MMPRAAFFRDLATAYEPIAPERFGVGGPGRPFPAGLNHAVVNRERFYRALARFERFGAGARRVLDVGVFPGTLPRLVRRHFGAAIECAGAGICFDAPFREAMAREGVSLHEVDLDPPPRVPESALRHPPRLPLGDASVDFAFATEVIEHLVWPLHMLGEVARVVRPGGGLLLTTPNASRVGGLLKQAAGGSAQEPILRSHIFTPPESEWRGHVRLYSMGELETMLDRAGFDTVHREWFSGSIDEFMTAGPARRLWLLLRRAFFLVPWLRNDLLIVGRRRPA